MSVCGCGVELECTDPHVLALVRTVYGKMVGNGVGAVPCIKGQLSFKPVDTFYRINLDDQDDCVVTSESDFLFQLEKKLELRLQELRPDLVFLHAASVVQHGRSVLLVAPSGVGKSTLTWALLHQGFQYLSDELAPVELEALRVIPYPRALCLKADPPEPFALPDEIVRTVDTIHVPIEKFPATAMNEAQSLNAIVFLERGGLPVNDAPRRLGVGESAVRLYANVLNALAHSHDGLDAAARMAESIPCYLFDSSNLLDAGSKIAAVLAASTPIVAKH